jgi:hypothetical protein
MVATARPCCCCDRHRRHCAGASWQPLPPLQAGAQGCVKVSRPTSRGFVPGAYSVRCATPASACAGGWPLPSRALQH